jgi:hypothetical protein
MSKPNIKQKDEGTKYEKNSILDSIQNIPALGNTWAHFINIRIILQFINDNKREVNLFQLIRKKRRNYNK